MIKFSEIVFDHSSISFIDSICDELVFMACTFQNYVNLQVVRIKELTVQECTIEKIVTLSGARIDKLSFLNSINLGNIYIRWTSNIAKEHKGKSRLKLFKKANAFETVDRIYDQHNICEERNFTSEEFASQFRMLKENFRNIGYYDDEDKAYRAYMKYKNKGFPRNLLKIFNLIGGYGTQPLRVLLTALVVIFGFAGLQLWQNWIGFVDKTQSFGSKFIEAIYFSGVTFFTIGFGDMAPLTGAAGIATVIEGFLGVALMSYFVVALVRKLLR